MSEEWYLRDASWHDRPNVSTNKKLHLKCENETTPLCGRAALLNVDTPFVNPPDKLKCKHCLKKWNTRRENEQE